jgi:very-short-patch-repair endonuclease
VKPALLDDLAPLLDPTALPRVIGRAGLAHLGFSRRALEYRLATGRWRRILPRTYLTSDTLTWPDRLAGALIFAGDGAILSGAAALVDTGLRCITRPTSILVLVPVTRRVSATGWVRISRTGRLPDRELAPGPARAPTPRAVADLAREFARLDDVRALVTEVVRRQRCQPDELAVELAEGPRRGSANLRRAIDEVHQHAWSAPEARTATLLRRAKVPPFEQNARIDLPSGVWLIADFLWRELRAVLEVDSIEHHFTPADLDATTARHLLLETHGYSVVHRSPAAINRDPAGFVRGVAQWLDSRRRVLGFDGAR